MSALNPGRLPVESLPQTKSAVLALSNVLVLPRRLKARRETSLEPPKGAQIARIVRECAVSAREHELSREQGLECIQSAPLFFGLPTSAHEEIESASRQRVCARGERIFCEDDRVQFVSVIARGKIKITQLSRTGKEIILGVEGASDVVDAVGLSSSKTHRISAHAMERCFLLNWDIPTFDALVRRYPEISRNATKILGERLCMMQERFRDMATERVPQRLARALLSLVERGVGAGRPYSVGISQEELAQMTGTTPFTVSRVLCEWAAQGIIQPERRIIVVESLARLAALTQGIEEI